MNQVAKRKNKTNKNLFWLNILIVFAVIFLDRITKLLVLNLNNNLKLFSFLEIIFVKNEGIVFGLFSNNNLNNIFIITSIISLIIILTFYRYAKNSPLTYFLSMILGGAIGNIIDRILYGYVIDFIKVDSFYVFNIADASITVGTILLIIYILFYEKEFKII
ncbi:MAG TPA: signal peptidase II [Caldisericia bacterium]|jgi:signal peptidase II|nr:signal peptidase II [Caldisericia bacterium]HOJ15567.1 signal peptidase II [Caldisericia bacterium]HOW02747.1 signal peptidase II [Caldisericia bacterium]HPO28409.1 signal peptidase II [Caldisericia bacterium]HQG82136.1 signal peptidase II [Caldisericia bacterium]